MPSYNGPMPCCNPITTRAVCFRTTAAANCFRIAHGWTATQTQTREAFCNQPQACFQSKCPGFPPSCTCPRHAHTESSQRCPGPVNAAAEHKDGVSVNTSMLQV
eukprot:8348-Chlamydomonas_euryale.AAC.3